jgi:subfamily B ATP-binding cassette protein HlyB/CyaB
VRVDAEFGNNLLTPATDPALACFVLLASFLGVPADQQQIHHDRGKGDEPYTFDDLLRVAKKLGLIARHKRGDLAELPKLPLPALVALADGGTAILLKVDDSGETGARYLVMPPGADRPIWPEKTSP